MDQSNYKPVFLGKRDQDNYDIMLSFGARVNNPDTGVVTHTILAQTGADWLSFNPPTGIISGLNAQNSIALNKSVSFHQQMATIQVGGPKPTNVPLRITVNMPNGETDGEVRMLFLPF